MAHPPAMQQPQPLLSQGAFLTGACFWAVMELAGIDMPDIIAQGVDPPAPGMANAGNAPPRQNPMARNKAMIRRPRRMAGS